MDGSDLVIFLLDYANGTFDESDLADFAIDFGRTDCP